MTQPDDTVLAFLDRSGLIPRAEAAHFEALAGGVSSDIWIVRADHASFCVKRALPRLRVAAEWHAPIARSASEVAWLNAAAGFMPEAVPRVLAADAQLGVFAMEYLPPRSYELWKTRLRRGVVAPETAGLVGERLACLHRAFAKSKTAAREFASDTTFHSLRIEPYLLATARAHPDVAPILEELADVTARTKLSVVHGDISPKNILLGADGPVFIDAECAWFGDPAFDLAFCLNHLLLKTVWLPSVEADLLIAFQALSQSYLAGVDWEPAKTLEQRAAHLLPALLLARIDGKSPVEYLDDEASKEKVRRAARTLLMRPPDRLEDLQRIWQACLAIGLTPLPIRGSDPHPCIERVIGRRVWDSRGRPTVEAEIFLDNGVSGRAIAPAGASTGANEAVDLRDGGKEFGGFGVNRAVGNITTEIAAALRGMPIADQASIDQRLIELDGTPNKARLGGNATIAVSMAALHAAAAAKGEPLWRYIADGTEPVLPMPMIQIFGGGAHASWRLDIQDFLIIPIGASTFDEAMVMASEVYQAAGRIMADRGCLHGVADEGGWWPAFASNVEALDTLVEAIERAELEPGTDVGIAIDVAASQLRRRSPQRGSRMAVALGANYHLAAEGIDLESEQLVELLISWCGRYPILSIEDPLAEDDEQGMRSFTGKMGRRIQIVGDDYLVTSADRIVSASASGACNAVLLKPNQVGTITETAAALTAARAAGWSAIVSARSGESEDVTIVHLAVGWGVGQLKVGSLARSERTAKWNEILRIEETLGPSAVFSRGFRFSNNI
jgi:phosphopyruvate hydratase